MSEPMNHKYRLIKRPIEIVEAEQWHPSYFPFGLQCTQDEATGQYYIVWGGILRKIENGHWVISPPTGGLIILKPADFLSQYEPVPSEVSLSEQLMAKFREYLKTGPTFLGACPRDNAWIALMDHRPPKGTLVIVATSHSVPGVARWKGIGQGNSGWVNLSWTDYPAGHLITHWQPMPSRPMPSRPMPMSETEQYACALHNAYEEINVITGLTDAKMPWEELSVAEQDQFMAATEALTKAHETDKRRQEETS